MASHPVIYFWYKNLMNQGKKRGEQLFALFIIGFVALNFPLLTIGSRSGFIFGIPVFYFYLFGIWLGLIALAAFIIRR